MTTSSLHHLDLNVSDLARSAAFYGKVLGQLGYAKGEEGDGWLSLRQGDLYLTLVQTKGRFLARGFHRRGIGVNHLAFRVDSREAVDEYAAWLEGEAIPILYGGPLDMSDGGGPNYAVFFEDPDRLKLEIVYMPD